MKIYTKTGDSGETGLFGGPRVRKHDPRIEAYGEVDELNAVLGLVRSLKPGAEIDRALERVQHELFGVGAELATYDPATAPRRWVGLANIEWQEREIDRWEAVLQPLREFILPGGAPPAAALHVARCCCRRAERRMVAAAAGGAPISHELLAYINRLSDLLFVLARAANQVAETPDVKWQKPD